jgi:alpha-methylacyl-CoA racemase
MPRPERAEEPAIEPAALRPLAGVRVVSLAGNVPGPVAAARLRGLGAEVVKVEPPGGDPLAPIAPSWYRALAEGQEIVTLDLKQPDGRAGLERMLEGADLLLTAMRPSALDRLRLGRDVLRAAFPRLARLAILGYPAPERERAGHDLTYQAHTGLLAPPTLPRSLLADLAAAERVVSTALALLLERARTGRGEYAEVTLAEAVEELAAPLRHGLTAPGGPLGGGLPAYALYRSADGWIALAALEPHFRRRVEEALAVGTEAREELERVFLARTSAEWERWAAERDLPLAALPARP